MTTRADTPRTGTVAVTGAQSISAADALLVLGVAALLPIALAGWLHAALPALLPLVIR